MKVSKETEALNPITTETPTDAPVADAPVADKPTDAPVADAGPKSIEDAIAAGLQEAAPVVPKTEKPEGEAPKEDDKPEEGKEGEEKDEEIDAEKKGDEKAKDPVNDPIPTGVADTTKERITSLIGMVKGLTTKAEERDELFQQIESTGVTADNFAATLQFLRAYNSDKIDDRRQAFAFLQGELKALAAELGEAAPGGDPLEGHQDLKDAVAALNITQQHAEELAASRNRQKATQRHTETTTARTTREKEEFNSAHKAATEGLSELGNTLAAIDPNYKAKAAILIPQLQEKFKTVHPREWVKTFQKAYADLKPPAAAPTAKPGNGASTDQPLRGNKTPAGDGKREPKTIDEAIAMGIAAGNR